MEQNKEPKNKPLHLWSNDLQHHWLNGHDFEQAPGVGDGQGSLVCCSPWGCKELDVTEQLNWTDLQQGFQDYSVGKGQSFQTLVHGNLDTHMQKNEGGYLHN